MVVKVNSVRVILFLSTNFAMPLYCLHVKNAFLHNALQVGVYMNLPPEFVYGS